MGPLLRINGCCSEWESKQLVKNHNIPQVIHMTPVHQLTSQAATRCVFWNKDQDILHIHYIAFSSESIVLSESGENDVQIKLCLQVKTDLKRSVSGLWCEGQQGMDFFTGESYIIYSGENNYLIPWWFCKFAHLNFF